MRACSTCKRFEICDIQHSDYHPARMYLEPIERPSNKSFCLKKVTIVFYFDRLKIKYNIIDCRFILTDAL